MWRSKLPDSKTNIDYEIVMYGLYLADAIAQVQRHTSLSQDQARVLVVKSTMDTMPGYEEIDENQIDAMDTDQIIVITAPCVANACGIPEVKRIVADLSRIVCREDTLASEDVGEYGESYTRAAAQHLMYNMNTTETGLVRAAEALRMAMQSCANDDDADADDDEDSDDDDARSVFTAADIDIDVDMDIDDAPVHDDPPLPAQD